MGKIGILTFHYSNNYGAVLQCMSLQNILLQMGFNVEIINYIPSDYNELSFKKNLGINKNIFHNEMKNLNPTKIFKKMKIKKQYNYTITNKFNKFRELHLNLGIQVNEKTIESILSEYDTIIVGSDQIWNPSQRNKREYFLDFGGAFRGRKISYAADSTIKEVNEDHRTNLKKCLDDFYSISVRNNHSYEFVKSIINENVPIVADPTILYNFDGIGVKNQNSEKYILAYILGKEIDGSHGKALKKIKKVYGNMPIYFIVIPTMNFDFYNFADKVLYDLGPEEWVTMFKNAAFVYTDSYHGVLFSLKFHKPFLAYYAEKMRSTRFIDLADRYDIDKYIVKNVDEIDRKKSLESAPDFDNIAKTLEEHKRSSINFLQEALK